ncbi:LuxR family transcriptional regulator [Streptomyces sp. NPDC001922]|uniref:LuxR family transcriptional regulator n=1 Tax=Streptomyces sp. NPDC001922 TaxID=3364624 RepID=UPI0036831432
MEKISLRTVAEEQLALAREAPAGRAAVTPLGGTGRQLRHTLIALKAGARMTEHVSPGEATVLVLTGRMRLESDDEAVEAVNGELIVLPPTRQAAEAVEDSTVLLTVVKP